MARRALTAQHDWYPAGTKTVSINEPPATLPRLEINQEKGVAGWHSLPDADEIEIYTPAGRLGEVVYPRTSRGKTLTYNLRQIQAAGDSYEDVSDQMATWVAAFQDRSSIGLLVATPWEGLVDDPPDVEIWATFARVLAFDADDLVAYGPNRQPSPHIRDCVASFRQLDGRWIHLNESGTWPDSAATPMEWTGTDSVEVDNTGNAETPPTITVGGVNEGEDLHVGRDLGGGFYVDLWFRDPVAVAGLTGPQDVVVDFPTRKVLIGTTDVTAASYDAAASSWWDEFVPGVPPGSHTIWHGPGSGTSIAVHFYSASW